ncbi:MAG: hypothetical protein AAF739_16925 [Pseudomonadota bacterium]
MTDGTNRYVEGMKLTAQLADPAFRAALEERLLEDITGCDDRAQSIIDDLQVLPEAQQYFTVIYVVAFWCFARRREGDPSEIIDHLATVARAAVGAGSRSMESD